MNNILQYTYEDWFNGSIVLNETPYEYQRCDDLEIINKQDANSPIGVWLEDINEADRLKIKRKQQDIFELKCGELFETWKINFLENYKRSQLKDLLVSDFISDFDKILFGNIIVEFIGADDVGRLNLKKTWYFKPYELDVLKEYFRIFIIDGFEKKYDFIPSPNCRYQNKRGMIPQVYAQFFYDCWLWLKDFQTNLVSLDKESSDGLEKKVEDNSALPFKELEGFNIDHWNQESYNLFNHLAENYNATAKKQKFINIWFYLKYDSPDNCTFNYPKKDYKNYITSKFNLDFNKSKMNKPNNYDIQLVILNDHYINYCDQLKALEKPLKNPL